MNKCKLNFIFNAHLPFVRHPEYPRFLEEDWFFEAINESYIPLLRMMNRLKEDKVSFKLTFSLSPTLCAMLDDELLKKRFEAFLNLHIALGHKEVERLQGDKDLLKLANMYLKNLQDNLDYYLNTCNRDILGAFNVLSNEGYIELVTTCATHAYLPIYKDYPVASNAQIEVGVSSHSKRFDSMPHGFWLPDCGFYPGLENLLVRNNIQWVSVASQALVLSDTVPKEGNYKPVCCENGLYCFPRDYNLTSLVWSSSEGYPGDPNYREFYRDIGYDLPMSYIGPYVHEPEVRVFTGYKYYAVTGQTSEKNVYDPEKASNIALAHGKNFIYHVNSRSQAALKSNIKDPVFTVSFDAELFGHWWYEGVMWLENVIRLSASSSTIELSTPGSYINEEPDCQIMTPAFSSWGEGGYSHVWADSSTNAKYLRHIFKALEHMEELAIRFPNQKSLKQRFITQASREVLLLMASDWPYIMYNHSSEEYAKCRLEGHLKNFNLVYDNMCKNAVNTEWLVTAEKRNNLFPNLDYNIFNPMNLQNPSGVYTTDLSK